MTADDAGAIALPQYYLSMVEWNRAFDVPIYLHADYRNDVMRPDSAIEFWQSETKPLFGGLTLIRCGGHFSWDMVAYWPDGTEGRGCRWWVVS